MLIIITTFTIVMYLLFSTIFHQFDTVGVIGQAIGSWNLKIFGYVAYIDFIFILLPVYSFTNNPKLLNKLDPYVGWILLLISLLIFQGLLVNHGGVISNILYSSLSPYIGKVGLWFLFFLSLVLSLTLITQKDFLEIIKALKLDNINSAIDDIKEKINSYYNQALELFFPKKDSIDDILKPHTSTKQTVRKEPKKSVPKRTKAKATPPTIKKEATVSVKSKEIENSEESTMPKAKSNTIVYELEENKKLLEDQIELGEIEKSKNFKMPPLNYLQKPKKSSQTVNEAEIDRKQKHLIEKLRQFKIEGDIKKTYTGPLVTTFEFKPAPNIKVSKILNLQDDLAMALSAETIRIQAPIPGKSVVGIEVPNDSFETIYLREILESDLFKKAKSPLAVALGKDLVGQPFVTDIKKLPHLLIAGTTGSGKSVGINAMILSLLYRNDPDNLKLILIDPKMLEFSIYNDIPHLLTPVIIEPKKAIIALANLVKEMENRYKLMAKTKVKNIDNFNQWAKKNNEETMPFIVVIIDELADLMMTGGKEVEYSIARLAQMARAAGIHIIVATQRPSVDVVTGIIKANLPARLSYRVGQKIDSKVILDAMGAEALLGRGDALFTPPGAAGLVRLHAPWNTEEEVEEVVNYLKAQRAPEYDESYFKSDSQSDDDYSDGTIELDELYDKAKEVVLTDRKTSISYLQRKLQIGYNRSANIIDQLEKMGVLSAPNNKGNREII
jgi:S-DNA-T family DNA segregation ATPase FtsK/SpoIIIE